MAIVKNRDWQDLYALVSGRKGCPPASYVKKELTNNKGRILACLNYFQLQEVKPSTSQDTLCSPCGNNWTKEKTSDVTAPFLMSKLHLMTVSPCLSTFNLLKNNYNAKNTAFKS